MKFYTDVHVAKEAVLQLRQKGVDIIHCAEVGLQEASDPDHLVYATAQKRVMISCDDDFERLHQVWQVENRPHAGIVYFRMADQCKQIGLVVREIIFLHETADYEADLYNQIWRVRT